MAVVSGLLGWYAVEARQAAKESASIEELQALSNSEWIATLREDEILWCGTGVGGIVTLHGRGPKWLRAPVDWCSPNLLYRADEVDLWTADFDDRIVEPLAKLRHLRTITLDETSVSEAGIERLRRAFPQATINYEPPDPKIASDSLEDPFGVNSE
jgi:hypothetical protein